MWDRPGNTIRLLLLFASYLRTAKLWYIIDIDSRKEPTMYTEPYTIEVPAQPSPPLPAWAVPVVEVELSDDLSSASDLDAVEVVTA